MTFLGAIRHSTACGQAAAETQRNTGGSALASFNQTYVSAHTCCGMHLMSSMTDYQQSGNALHSNVSQQCSVQAQNASSPDVTGGNMTMCSFLDVLDSTCWSLGSNAKHLRVKASGKDLIQARVHHGACICFSSPRALELHGSCNSCKADTAHCLTRCSFTQISPDESHTMPNMHVCLQIHQHTCC